MMAPTGEVDTQVRPALTAARRDQFLFVDGLRALAALVVVTYHAMLFTGNTDDYQRSLPSPLRLILEQGHYGVAVFIVLSGFVLGLPAARNGGRLRGGWRRYAVRRARRILPPYYAALAMFLALIAAVPLLQQGRGTAWDSKVPVTSGGLISHLLLVHNARWDWQGQIDGPMWSVATEWQLYFLLPALLLPLWRRWGVTLMVTVSVVIGVGVHYVAPALDGAHLWYLGLCAFGMAAARAVVVGVEVRGRLGASAVVLAVLAVFQPRFDLPTWVLESAVGVVVALTLVRLADSGGRARQVLEHRRVVGVGLFSYSIYLVHSPLLGLANLLLLPVQMPWLLRFAVMLLVVVPAAIGVSYLFHLAIERRFLTSHQRDAVPAATA
jgi:peptidoglycan/LPS O-acetylase OafA/YrhL